MKSLIRFFFLPLIALLGLNIILLIYINTFQSNVLKHVAITNAASDYLTLIDDEELKLDSYLNSGQLTDSLNYTYQLQEIQEKSKLLVTLYSPQKELADSLQNSVEIYINSLKELETVYSDLEMVSKKEMTLMHSLVKRDLEKIRLRIARLNENYDRSIIGSLGQAKVQTRYLFILCFLILVLIFLLAYWQFIRPLYTLRTEIQKLSEGTYSQIKIDRKDEIGDLIRVFNQTSRSLQLSELRLKKTNQELAVTNKELESFAYSVSHDLRSPLRSISGFSEALVNNFSSNLPETAKDYLGRVNKASIKMGELIDEILKLSRISRRELHRETVNITALAQEIIELTKTENENHFSFTVEKNLTINGDKGLTKIILLNLLSNAMKFTSKNDRPIIQVGTTINNGTSYIFIKDNGVGFDMKYVDKIFGAFQRLHTDNAFEGTGIGLATVMRIINKHGGNIFYESEKDKGTTVYFNLGE